MAEQASDGWANYIDEQRLAQVEEEAIEPEIEIIDPHHHFMVWPVQYEVGEWLAELDCGHRVIATVHTEAHGHYRSDGPDHLKPAGETEYLTAAAERADRIPDAPRVCAGIVGGGDLAAGGRQVDELLDAHIAAGKGRFRGIRMNLFWGFDTSGCMFPMPGWEQAVDRPEFRDGVRRLTARDLCLELVCHHPNLPHVARLAAMEPDARIVVNHLGTIMDRSENPAPESELLGAWRNGIDAIAERPNVVLKLGGCANPMISHSMPAMRALGDRPMPPTSEELASAYRPQVSYAIEKLGPSRCMFESNFPIDKNFTSYTVLWNAFKRLSQPCSQDEKRRLMSGTAKEVYRLDL